MLVELHIKNFALIEEARIAFAPRFNCLTGETGAGKSLLIGALDLLLGGRASTDVVRTGCDEAEVQGLFDITHPPTCKAVENACNIEIPDGQIILRRILSTSGRPRCYINGQAATASMLKEVGQLLVDVHGQRDHDLLLNTSHQLEMLDSYASTDELRDKFAGMYGSLREGKHRLDSLIENEKSRKEQIELYEFQIAEIDAAKLDADEIAKLQHDRQRLMHAEKIITSVTEALRQIHESDGAVQESLDAIARSLDKLTALDADLQPVADSCGQVALQLEDVAVSLRKYLDDNDFDPTRQQAVEERLDVIHKLQLKYGESAQDILTQRDEIETSLHQLRADETDSKELESQLAKLAQEILATGKKLSTSRKRAATKLAKEVQTELRQLGMEQGRFEIQMDNDTSKTAIDDVLQAASLTGFDRVEFVISTNPGEPLKPLKKIASGGEVSRIMLALKQRLADADKTPVVIFDEIDANIGGRIARRVGDRLRRTGNYHQVLCVTHLPQIATCADRQLKVQKSVRGKQTFTEVITLDEKSRLQEIAEMIRGEEKTKVTLDQAREMLADAQK